MNRVTADKNGLEIEVTWKHGNQFNPALRKVFEALLTPVEKQLVEKDKMDNALDKGGQRS